MSFCTTCPVRETAMCSKLDDEGREALGRMGRRLTLKRGQGLIWEGDNSMIVANVVEGSMKLAISTMSGREQIVGVAFPADFIGRPFGTVSRHAVTALSDAMVCIFPRGDFDSFAKQHPELEHDLLARTLADLDQARTWMLVLARKTAREKIATFLLEMAHRSAPDETAALSFDLPLTRQQIADVLGTTIETVSRQMHELKHEGVIALPSRSGVRILDREALQYSAEAA